MSAWGDRGDQRGQRNNRDGGGWLDRDRDRDRERAPAGERADRGDRGRDNADRGEHRADRGDRNDRHDAGGRRGGDAPPGRRAAEADGGDVAECRVACYPLATRDRQYGELRCRYPNLHLSNDLVRVNAHWTTSPLRLTQITAAAAVDLTYAHMTPPAARAPRQAWKHNVRVMLLSIDRREAHAHDRLRFTVGQGQGVFLPIGGFWTEADGGDPFADETLHKTAIRTARSACGVDLSGVQHWHKWLEVEYDRPDEGREYPAMRERTVMLLPDTWSPPMVATLKVHQQVDDQYLEWESFNPRPRSADDLDGWLSRREEALRGKSRLKYVNVPLGRLLDYRRDDIVERSTELFLFAEACAEHLQRDYGRRIWAVLSAPAAAEPASGGRSESGEPPAKQPRVAPDDPVAARLYEKYDAMSLSNLRDYAKKTHGTVLPATMKRQDIVKWITEREVPGSAAEPAAAAPQAGQRDSTAALEPWLYFDRERTDKLAAAVLEQLLYDLGDGLPRRSVHDAVRRAMDAQYAVNYRALRTSQ